MLFRSMLRCLKRGLIKDMHWQINTQGRDLAMSGKGENKVRGEIRQWDLAYSRPAHPREKTVGNSMECFFTAVQEGAGGKQSQGYDLKKTSFKNQKHHFCISVSRIPKVWLLTTGNTTAVSSREGVKYTQEVANKKSWKLLLSWHQTRWGVEATDFHSWIHHLCA